MTHSSRNDEKLQQRFQKILEELLKDPANDKCADCGEKGPRWASVNLGIFVCIRCSGIHRNMGTHISKVKSVSLDKWQPEMIKNMEVIGNANARLIYEGRLPERYNRPRESDNYAVEQWIRDKYDRKKWYDPAAEQRILSGASSADSPQSRTNGEDEQRRARREERRRKREEERKRQEATTRGSAASSAPADLLFDPFGTAYTPSVTPIASAPAPSMDPNLMFSDFQSASSSNAQFIEQNSNASFFQQPGQSSVPSQVQPVQTQVTQPAQAAVNPKESIMSLFRSQPTAPAHGVSNYGGGYVNQMGGFQPAGTMGGVYMNQGQGVPNQQFGGAIPNNMGMGTAAAQPNYNVMYNLNMNASNGVPAAAAANNSFGMPPAQTQGTFGLPSQNGGYQSAAANSYA